MFKHVSVYVHAPPTCVYTRYGLPVYGKWLPKDDGDLGDSSQDKVFAVQMWRVKFRTPKSRKRGEVMVVNFNHSSQEAKTEDPWDKLAS